MKEREGKSQVSELKPPPAYIEVSYTCTFFSNLYLLIVIKKFMP